MKSVVDRWLWCTLSKISKSSMMKAQIPVTLTIHFGVMIFVEVVAVVTFVCVVLVLVVVLVICRILYLPQK